MQTIPFDEAVAKKFRLPQAPTLLAQRGMASPIAFSRLRIEGAFPGRTIAAAPDEAFTFQVALMSMSTGISGSTGNTAS